MFEGFCEVKIVLIFLCFTGSRPVGVEVGHELLFLGEHGLEGVELTLQLLDGDLGAALGSRGVLTNERLVFRSRDQVSTNQRPVLLTLVATQELSSPTLPSSLFQHSTY